MRRIILAALLIAVSVTPIFAQNQRQRNGQQRSEQMAGTLVQNAMETLAQQSDPLEIIYRKDVQRDLKLDLGQRNKLDNLHSQQLKDISAAQARNRRNRTALEEPQEKARQQTQEKIDELLTQAQKDRLQQVSWQLMGNTTLFMDEIQKKLGVTSDQKQQLTQIQADRDQKVAQLQSEIASRQVRPNEVVSELKKINGATSETIAAVLSDDQKSALQKLYGENFKADI